MVVNGGGHSCKNVENRKFVMMKKKKVKGN